MSALRRLFSSGRQIACKPRASAIARPSALVRTSRVALRASSLISVRNFSDFEHGHSHGGVPCHGHSHGPAPGPRPVVNFFVASDRRTIRLEQRSGNEFIQPVLYDLNNLMGVQFHAHPQSFPEHILEPMLDAVADDLSNGAGDSSFQEMVDSIQVMEVEQLAQFYLFQLALDHGVTLARTDEEIIRMVSPETPMVGTIVDHKQFPEKAMVKRRFLVDPVEGVDSSLPVAEQVKNKRLVVEYELLDSKKTVEMVYSLTEVPDEPEEDPAEQIRQMEEARAKAEAEVGPNPYDAARLQEMKQRADQEANNANSAYENIIPPEAIGLKRGMPVEETFEFEANMSVDEIQQRVREYAARVAEATNGEQGVPTQPRHDQGSSQTIIDVTADKSK